MSDPLMNDPCYPFPSEFERFRERLEEAQTAAPALDLSARAVRERLQNEKSFQALSDLFGASSEDLGKAAVALAEDIASSRKPL